METNAILAAIEAAIGQRYPGETVYWGEIPQGAQRPSFKLECQKAEWADAGAGMVRKNATILVTCLPGLDQNQLADRRELNSRQDGVMQILTRDPLKAGDRALTAQSVKGTGLPDSAQVSAVFTWLDGRAEDGGAQPGDTPLMEHYKLDVINRKEG